jgi:hypothetical protein
MKTRPLFRLLPFLAIANAAADSFELKDGRKFEGTIIKEEGSDYIIQVQVTKSIKDEQRIPKADVVSQIAEKKDETEFAKLNGMLPVPDMQTEEVYTGCILAVEKFVKAYPKSPKLKEALKMIDVLEGEKAVVVDGGVKFGGKMIPASARAPKAYGLDASMIFAAIKDGGDKGETIGALRMWTVLETGFPGSSAYQDNIPYAVALMKKHLAAVTATLTGLDARVKARAAGLAGMAEGDRARSKAAIDDEQNSYLARVAKEKAEGVKWPSLDPHVKVPLEETKRQLENEIRRLEKFDTTNLQKTEEAYETAYDAITKATKKQEVDSALSTARSANVPQAYLDQLTKAAPVFPAP